MGSASGLGQCTLFHAPLLNHNNSRVGLHPPCATNAFRNDFLRRYVYSQVAAVVEPKRAKLKEAQAELEVTEHLLKEKQAALKIVSDRVAALEASFALTLQEQEDLKTQVIYFI